MWQKRSCMRALRSHCTELCKCDLHCIGDIKTFEVPEPWDVYHGELLTGSGTSPREEGGLQSAELEGQNILSYLTPDLELQGRSFVLLLSALLSSSISSLCLFSPFLNGNVHCTLEVCHLLLISQGVTGKKCYLSQKRLWTLKEC